MTTPDVVGYIRSGSWPVVLPLLFLWLAMIPGLAGVPSGWQTNLSETLQSAGASNRPVLLYFTADWCGPCRQMARTTLIHPTVATLLGEFVPVALDLDAHSQDASDRHVSAIPAFLVLTADGAEVTRMTGYLDAEGFQRFLTTALVAADLARDRQEEFLRLRKEITTALADGSAESRRRAVQQLLKLGADRELPRQKFAFDQFQALAAVAPAELLEGLVHPQLAVRLAVANALRNKLGERFEFDPWATAEERQGAVVELRQMLSR